MTVSSNTPKWKIVENVVAAIERSLNKVTGTKVIPNAFVLERISSVPRQVDVYLEIPTGPRTLRIGVEVRDEAAPADLPEIEQLITKLKKLDLDYGCIVSRAGFTGTATEEAKRHGIELRTVAQVENPDWWLPSSMTLFLRKVELLHMQVNFHPAEYEKVQPLVTSVKASDLVLNLPNGTSHTLPDFIKGQGIQAINRPELSHLRDQDTFAVNFLFTDLMNGATLACPSGNMPLPQSVDAHFKIHVNVESVELTAYEGSEGINAFTGISNAWGKQLTMVSKLQDDGSRILSFTMDDPRPSKTAIPRREEPAEPVAPLDPGPLGSSG